MASNDRAFQTRNSDFPRGTKAETRAVSSLVGILTLLVVTVVLAAVVAAGANSIGTAPSPPAAGFDLAADGQQSTIELEHIGGDSIDVDKLAITIEINGDPLESQPPVPFVGAEGFDETPTGPFNARSDSIWRGGESASVRLASTNEPGLETGDTVTVTLAIDTHRIAVLEETAT
ncbi:type IV pilin [Halostagnicola bangensis]